MGLSFAIILVSLLIALGLTRRKRKASLDERLLARVLWS